MVRRMTAPILVGRAGAGGQAQAERFDDVVLLPQLANRHGLVAGATGTGKTVTLRVMAEGFSRAGVPVFLADVKGDLSGLARPGGDAPAIQARAQQLGLKLEPDACPTVFLDVYGEGGHP